MTNLLDHALKVHNWGGNVTAVFGKSPGHTWKTWETKRQTVDDVKALVTSKKKAPIWPIATGYGAVSGPGGWRYFDLDHAPDPDPAYHLLEKLGLPQNYNWLVQSGSGEGWGVWVICNDDLPSGSLVASGEKGIFWGLPISGLFDFDHIELRWSNCQTVLPPSEHPTGPGYKWVNGQPDAPPAVVTVGDILSAFYAVAVPRVAAEEKTPHRPQRLRTNGREDDLKEEIKNRLDVLTVAQTLYPGGLKNEPTGEIRILGHGGLLVNQDKQLWHDFLDTIGGDIFSLIGYEKFGVRWDDQDPEMFKYALRRGGELAGIEVPTNGRRIRVNGPAPAADESSGWGNYLLDEESTDEGNAQCLVKMFPNRFLMSDAMGWLFYNGKFWQRDQSEGILDRHIVTMLTERRKAAVAAGVDDNGKWLAEHIVRYCKAISRRLKDCKYNLSSVVMSSASDFDADRDLLNCHNGVVNLRTGELAAHDQSQRFTYHLPIDYNPNADYSFWEDWLMEAVEGGRETVKYIQQAVGYSLTGHTSEECLFYLFGPTRAGKGTFTETILKMLGHPLGDEVDFNTFTAQRDHDANNFDLAGLKATRFIAASESNKYQLLNPRRIKLVTGGNAIRCSFKHKDFFSYWPQFTLWLSSNHPVKADEADDAIWGRVNVIHFPNSFLGREDKNLKRKMLEPSNLMGVLTWGIEGAIDWYKSLPAGLSKPAAVVAETQKHRDENDISGRFIGECTVPDPDHFLPNPVIKAVYTAWCDINSLKPKERTLFTRLSRDYNRPQDAQPVDISYVKTHGYDQVEKMTGFKSFRKFRGYFGVRIPPEVLAEYL